MRSFFITLTGAALLGCSAAETPEQNDVSAQANTAPVLVRPDGTYATVPLEKDEIVLKVIQTAVTNISDFDDPNEGLEQNLAHMEMWARRACSEGDKPDIILFHEFPLTGYNPGPRDEKIKFTVQFPGPESDRLGALARECDAYIVFGSYASDPAWPGHILSINVVLGRDGEIKKTFWKSRNIKRLWKDKEINTTTVESVRDAYRARYGMDEEFPVLRTEFGNIAVSTVQWDPMIFSAFAMKGTEIMLRTATLYDIIDVQATARQNNFYSAMANIPLPINPNYTAGESIIVGPDGKTLALEPSMDKEGMISARIPIREFREGRTLPHFALEMVQPVFDQYVQEIPLNHMDKPAEDLPQTDELMKEMLDKESRWLNAD